MTEIIGKCISVDEKAMWILDEDEDKIEMVLSGVPKKGIDHLKSLIGKHISFYYDNKGMKIRALPADQKYVRQFPEGVLRTPETILFEDTSSKKE